MTAPAPAALRALLHGLVDYAGLFPPAALDVPDAVRRFAGYRAGAERWMLARFVLPAGRLDAFAEAAAAHQGAEGGPWRLSALVGPDVEGDLARIARFNAAARAGGSVVDAVEARAGAPADVARLAALVPRSLATYVELPAAPDPAPLVAALREGGLRAKLRTGGVTADAFPAPARVVAFLAACAAAEVPCKLTAGLHHPLCGDYALTYAPDSPRGAMLGFVNAFVAALLLREGAGADVAGLALRESDAAAFAFDDDALRWRDRTIPTARVADGRARLAHSFGSCSFEEPASELRAMGWLG